MKPSSSSDFWAIAFSGFPPVSLTAPSQSPLQVSPTSPWACPQNCSHSISLPVGSIPKASPQSQPPCPTGQLLVRVTEIALTQHVQNATCRFTSKSVPLVPLIVFCTYLVVQVRNQSITLDSSFSPLHSLSEFCCFYYPK